MKVILIGTLGILAAFLHQQSHTSLLLLHLGLSFFSNLRIFRDRGLNNLSSGTGGCSQCHGLHGIELFPAGAFTFFELVLLYLQEWFGEMAYGFLSGTRFFSRDYHHQGDRYIPKRHHPVEDRDWPKILMPSDTNSVVFLTRYSLESIYSFFPFFRHVFPHYVALTASILNRITPKNIPWNHWLPRGGECSEQFDRLDEKYGVPPVPEKKSFLHVAKSLFMSFEPWCKKMMEHHYQSKIGQFLCRLWINDVLLYHGPFIQENVR